MIPDSALKHPGEQMLLPRITSLLEQCHDNQAPFPATQLFNEGWLLRLILDWHDQHREKLSRSPLQFADGACWYSEARLTSPFLAKFRGDTNAEGYTHADGIVGHFNITQTAKCGIRPDATQFVVTEAKLGSSLSPGVANAPGYDQAARNVACMAEELHLAGRHPKKVEKLAFYVVAPGVKIQDGTFDNELRTTSIIEKVQQRVSRSDGVLNEWFENWFLALLEKIDLRAIAWETLIAQFKDLDADSHREIDSFYDRCLHHARIERIETSE